MSRSHTRQIHYSTKMSRFFVMYEGELELHLYNFITGSLETLFLSVWGWAGVNIYKPAKHRTGPVRRVLPLGVDEASQSSRSWFIQDPVFTW